MIPLGRIISITITVYLSLNFKTVSPFQVTLKILLLIKSDGIMCVFLQFFGNIKHEMQALRFEKHAPIS